MSKGLFLPLPAVLLIFWLVFFFPRWYVLTYTKIWELKQMVGEDRETQLRVMHPAPMRRLLELKHELKNHNPETTVVVLSEGSKQLPLAGNAAIVRSILFPYPILLVHENRDQYSKIFRIDVHCPVSDMDCWEIQP